MPRKNLEEELGENKAIRESYSWVPMTQKCYLVMDNTGGHGTDSTIEKYTTEMLEKYNIQIIQQVPRSPYTNLLDLGVWCALQARVERTHYMRRCEVGALVKSVLETWNTDPNLHECI